MPKGPIHEKSFAFALRVVKLAKFLQGEKKEYVLSKQVLRSGTAIGALVREAEHAESKADFIHKMAIALKEANETLYWGCTEFCGTGFQPVEKHGQDGRATLLDTKFRTVPSIGLNCSTCPNTSTAKVSHPSKRTAKSS